MEFPSNYVWLPEDKRWGMVMAVNMEISWNFGGSPISWGFPVRWTIAQNLMTRRLSGFLKNNIDDHMSIRLMDTRSCQFCFNPLCLVRAFVWYRTRSCFFSFKPDCSIRICPSDGSHIWYKWTINCVDVHQAGHFWHLTRRLIVENHDFGEQNEAFDFRANYPLVIQHVAMENQHFLRWFFSIHSLHVSDLEPKIGAVPASGHVHGSVLAQSPASHQWLLGSLVHFTAHHLTWVVWWLKDG